MLMQMSTHRSNLFLSSGEAAERRTVLVLIAVYWIGFQIIYFAYASLREQERQQGIDAWLSGLLQYVMAPSELVVCGLGALLCYALYLAIKMARGRPFWQQLVCAVLAMFAGAFVFSAVAQLTIATMADAPFTFRLLLLGGLASIAPLGLWTVTVLALSYNAEIRDRERRLAMVEAQAHQAQVSALRYQVNPHFLFNTLNSISALILEHRAQDAERMVLALANFFRATITADPLKDVRLADEIALQKLYLDIEQIRFADCLAVEIDMPSILEGARMPGLILQPLIENALSHDLREPGETLVLKIGAHAEGDLLVVEVHDNGPDNGTARGRADLGLPDVRERLVSRFGARARMDAGMEPSGFRVRLTMPLEFA
ncbi:sensor histidine kinase [Sphingomonas sp. LaA6.9]|uniref:sensor histidine kinase n=1 Tax=Sphingomonas sp. LaA6.9 TaxID=2919914 RepID=UPI001F4FA9CC|nr:histidine kinase [Sphingomonas sp. LaA6.9]MCJ8158428.1 histidine kinase [Sphingomonas sp. LaA6.9]